MPVALELSARQRRWLWWLLAITVVARLATLGAYPLPDPSESRYAEMARKMLETGNWLVPQFDYGIPFWGKPPLSFWLTAAAMKAFGVNEFAARLPSALLMIGCGALVHALANAAAGRNVALLCAVVFATTGLVFIGAGAVVTDPALAFGTTLAMAGFWLAAHGAPEMRRRWGFAFFVGIAIGLLAKGPIAVVLTALPIGAWMVWQRNWRGLGARLPWVLGSLLVLVLVVPWYWAVERATPGFLDYFLIGEHWKRFTEPGWTGDRYGVAHSWKRGWIWLFWVGAAVPWSIVAIDWLVRVVAAPRDRVRARLADPLFRYVLCWALAPLVFFTASRNVLITYVLPGLPAFALLLGLFGPVASGAARTLDRAEKRALGAWCVLGVALAVALVTQYDRIDRELTQRGLVRAYEAQRIDPEARLLYVGDQPVSAAFYTQGKAERLPDFSALAAYLAEVRQDFFAIRADDLRHIAADDLARMAPAGTFGEFRLYREVTPPPRSPVPAPPPSR
jgi:4-amino-4-deoxy-L-arabinose transferase-like glycosyltransferase